MTSSHNLPRTILLFLAVVGAVAPWLFFARFFATEGSAGFVPPSSSTVPPVGSRQTC
jgi:hypothetical protein